MDSIPIVRRRLSSVSTNRVVIAALCVLLVASCASGRYVLINNRTSGPLQVEIGNNAERTPAGAVAAGEQKRVEIPEDFDRWKVYVDDSLVASSEIGDALRVDIAPDGGVSVARVS